MRKCFEIPERKIALEQCEYSGWFTVTYSRQVKQFLNYEESALELGAVIMHSLACDGLLDCL